MSLSKPSWLETLLSHLNWDILTWHVYVGDAIESAIDWVLGWIDSLAEWAAQISAWWEDFRQEVIDALEVIKASIVEQIKIAIADVTLLFTDPEEWWETKKPIVEAWLNTLLEPFGVTLDDLTRSFDEIKVKWDEFWTVTFPTLASKFDITAAFDQFMLTWSDLFEGWEAFKDSIVDFFNDPLEWLWARFTDWFLGPEE